MIENGTSTIRNAFFLFLTSLLLFSCGSVKKVKWSTEHILVQSAYVQKYVSGQEDGGEPNTFLFIDIKILDSTILLDSATYENYTIAISAVRLPLKINWKKGTLNRNAIQVENKNAILYYSKEKKRFKRIVEGIIVKEDLYLP